MNCTGDFFVIFQWENSGSTAGLAVAVVAFVLTVTVGATTVATAVEVG